MTTPDIEAIISKEQNLNMILKWKQLHKKGPSNRKKKKPHLINMHEQ